MATFNNMREIICFPGECTSPYPEVREAYEELYFTGFTEETCNKIKEAEEAAKRRVAAFNTGIDWTKAAKGIVEQKTTVKEHCDFCREDKSYSLDQSYGQRKICKKCQNLPEPTTPFSVDESFWC